jgi:hypothetical protein
VTRRNVVYPFTICRVLVQDNKSHAWQYLSIVCTQYILLCVVVQMAGNESSNRALVCTYEYIL